MNAKEMGTLLKLPIEIRQKWEKNNPTASGKIQNLSDLKRQYHIISKLFWGSILLSIVAFLWAPIQKKYFDYGDMFIVTLFLLITSVGLGLMIYLSFKKGTIESVFHLFKKDLARAEIWDENDVVGEGYELIKARIDNKLTLLAVGIINAEKTVKKFRYDNRISIDVLISAIKDLESSRNQFSELHRQVVNLGISDGDKRLYFERAKAFGA